MMFFQLSLDTVSVSDPSTHFSLCLSTFESSVSQVDDLEKAMASHSSTLAWKIPWTEEPGRLQSMGSRRVGHD